MTIEFALTDEFFNTQHAPLAVLLAHYQQNEVLKPLEQVTIEMKRVEFTAQDKLQQVLVSILAGCETLSEVNIHLKSDQPLGQAGGWSRFADQSVLSQTLDRLTLMNIDQLQTAVWRIWHNHSATLKHDWRAFLWLDFDLSGLVCSKQAQGSQKGYFSGKKTPQDDN